jgi:ArsR family transcriptional regulator
MKSKNAVQLLAALAQETRLDIFRALVRAGQGGLAAGAIAEVVGAAASTLSFHLKELSHAGLVQARQEGRFIYYSVDYTAMSQLVTYLTENCCQGMPAMHAARIGEAAAACCAPATKQRRPS